MEIINHRPFRMDPLNMDVAPGVLKQAYLLGDKYFITAGTFLGLHRDGDFIPGDTDIDIDILGYDGIGEYLFNVFGFMDLIRTGYHKELPMQIAFMYRKTIFDIWVWWRDGDQMVNYNDMGITKIPARFYESPTEIETKYGTFRVPGPIDDYLAFRYGPDWKTPQNNKGVYTHSV